MKALKVSLVIIVLAAIGAGIFFWIQSPIPPQEVKAPKNQFTLKIEQEIEKLKAKSDSKFCGDFYNLVASQINDFYKQNRFDSNTSGNKQWKDDLESNLYTAYSEKFINQAKYVFRGSEWKSSDLKFIQNEMNRLKRSKLLIPNSPVDKDFTTIQNTLNKYNEIISFISSCKSYSYSETELSAHFPIADVQRKIYRASSLLQNRLENRLVNNCTHLHDGLREIPQSLFRAHVRYLDNKINNWLGLYSNYNSQKDYSNNLNKPLKAEIETLDNDIYKVSNIDNEYNRLLQNWSADNTNAYEYFKKYKKP
jgi:hypothetical protein